MSWVLRRAVLLLRTSLVPNPLVTIQQRAVAKSISLYSCSTKDHSDSLASVRKDNDVVSEPHNKKEDFLPLVDNAVLEPHIKKEDAPPLVEPLDKKENALPLVDNSAAAEPHIKKEDALHFVDNNAVVEPHNKKEDALHFVDNNAVVEPHIKKEDAPPLVEPLDKKENALHLVDNNAFVEPHSKKEDALHLVYNSAVVEPHSKKEDALHLVDNNAAAEPHIREKGTFHLVDNNVVFEPCSKKEDGLPLVNNMETYVFSVPEKKLDPFSLVKYDDVAHIKPPFKPSNNLAPLVNRAETLQKLVDLGVNIAKWEKRRDVSFHVLSKDFETGIQPYLTFLLDIGVEANDLGYWLSHNPVIFSQSFDVLQERIEFLVSCKLSKEEIRRVLVYTPEWLNKSVPYLVKTFKFFQYYFALDNDQLRYLINKKPKIFLRREIEIKKRNFLIHEELGFTRDEMNILIRKIPYMWLIGTSSLRRQFGFIHNVMGLSHTYMVTFPIIFTSREFKLKERHFFLKSLNRDQYDTRKPNYVSAVELVSGTDEDFCVNVAKSTTEVFDSFLKSLSM